jgi:uncharacterized protein (TIGR03435 family)
VSSTTAIIAGAISTHSVQAAPVALAKSVTAVALTKGAVASSSTLTLIKGALKIMAWTKAKTAMVAGACVLLAAGTTTITVKEIQEQRTYPWQDIPLPKTTEQVNLNLAMLKQFSPQVRIVPTKFPQRGSLAGYELDDGERLLGIAVKLNRLIEHAYKMPTTRVIFPARLSEAEYDFIANLPKGSFPALQREIERKFGLVVTRQMRETDVLLLKVRHPNARGLQPASGQNTLKMEDGRYEVKSQPLSLLAFTLEYNYFKIPVVDRTGLAGPLDVTLTWDSTSESNLDALKESLLTQLGLELVPNREPVEMLVVEKVK